jgi:uncharacterized protein (TIRG00374 family)
LPLAFYVAAWTFNLLITYFVFLSLGIYIPLSGIIVVFSIIDALHSVPLGIPGEVGLMEIVMTTLYTALGVFPAFSATIAILVRFVTMWFKLLVGVMVVRRIL